MLVLQAFDSDQGKVRVLKDIYRFINSMDLMNHTLIELTPEAEQLWKNEENFHEQEQMGRDILKEFGTKASAIIVADRKRQPVLLMSRGDSGWEGLSIDPRLRGKTQKFIADRLS